MSRTVIILNCHRCFVESSCGRHIICTIQLDQFFHLAKIWILAVYSVNESLAHRLNNNSFNYWIHFHKQQRIVHTAGLLVVWLVCEWMCSVPYGEIKNSAVVPVSYLRRSYYMDWIDHSATQRTASQSYIQEQVNTLNLNHSFKKV